MLQGDPTLTRNGGRVTGITHVGTILWVGVAVGYDTQIFGDGIELVKGVFKVVDDLEGEFFQRWDLVSAFLAFVAEPEDIEAEFVAFEQFFVAIAFETFSLL